MSERWHGTTGGYTNHNCRCQPCRDAQADYMLGLRAVRRQRIARDPGVAEHGRDNTYTNWGCRCVPCTEAHRVARRQKARTR